jgi:DNA-binding CsgD family transcriptional regulator
MGGRDTRIVGRDSEVARFERALTGARAGHPAVVLLVGPAGIGKTALWRHVLTPAGMADGAAVIVATGDEAETELEYGVIEQLLRRAPVDAATRARLAPRPGSDPVSVGAALLSLIDGLDVAAPVSVVVDDAQWADEQSLRALTFAARRLHDDRVLLCLTCRAEGLDRLPAGLVRLVDAVDGRIDIGPLDVAAVAELAERRYGQPVPARVAARLHAHTGGSPLHVRTLLDELPVDAAGAPATLPAPHSYAALVIAQVAGCHDVARDLIAALAVLGAAAPVADVARVAGCPDPMAALDELAARGLVEHRAGATGPVVRFPHGLVRAAILGDLSPSRRAALHTAAVAVTAGDEALGHRLAAGVGPDPDLVDAARARAGEHVRAGAPAAAARQLLAAAPRAGSPDDREKLVAVAATQLVLAGAPIGPLAAEIAGFVPSAPRSYVLGREALNHGDATQARALLVDAWERATSGDTGAPTAPRSAGATVTGPPEDEVELAAVHRRMAGPAADTLAILALHHRDGDEVVTWADRALAAGSRSGVSATLLCHGLALDGRLRAAVDAMTTLLADGPPPAVACDAHLGRGIVRVWSNDLDGAAADLAAAADGVADELDDAPGGAEGLHPGSDSLLARVDVRSYQAEVAYRAGRWPEALDLAEAIASVVDDAGDAMFVALPHAVAAFVLAGMGRVDDAQAHLDAATASAEATGLMPARLWAAHATLRVAAATADHQRVADVGDALVAEGLAALPEGIHHWRATYVEALVALDRLDDATRTADDLGRLADAGTDVSLAADAARAAGTVAAARGRGEEAARRFAAGLALDPVASRPFERARLELTAGAHLRRTGSRREAAAVLGEAARRLDALGAAPWAARCVRELDACGLRPRRRGAGAPLLGDAALTAQERLVAHLVAGGRTNREVAAELVITTKTVEHHIGRVYAKLGLRSRSELAARIAAATDGPGPPGPADGSAGRHTDGAAGTSGDRLHRAVGPR